MSKRESISRYNLIIKKLRKHPASFKEISDYLALESEIQGYDFNIGIRTFQRDLEDIRSLYNIDIQYNHSKKGYQIEDDQNPQGTERILEAFDTFNALNITDRLSEYIHFENRKPQGTENLYGLLHAIKKKVQIEFRYHKFWTDEHLERTVEPYALKEFKNRWYLLARDINDEYVKSFGLDRLSELEITRRPFLLPLEFNVVEHFKYCFGIVSPNADHPEDIILSFTPVQGKYIKSLPLHETQEILEDSEKQLLIKLKLFITRDFIMELLSYGDDVKVVEPEGLVNEIKEVYGRAAGRYK